MDQITPGAYVECKIRGNSIVPIKEGNFDVVLEFEVIGFDRRVNRNLLFIPPFNSIKNSFNLTEESLELYNLQPKWLDYRAYLIGEERVVRIKYKNTAMDGLYCGHCGEYAAMANPNQSNGGFVCFLCRSNFWGRMS